MTHDSLDAVGPCPPFPDSTKFLGKIYQGQTKIPPSVALRRQPLFPDAVTLDLLITDLPYERAWLLKNLCFTFLEV